MTIFQKSFREEVITELEARRAFDYTQDYISPYIRVTSLITSEFFLPNQRLNGFTLGIPDNEVANTIESVFSNPSTGGGVVGMTYTNRGKDNPPELVRLKDVPSHIPTPGVTSVNINSLYKGGFVFEAEVGFKFYTKTQYDFLYQTFFRPGTHVVIEYGYRSDKNDGVTNILKEYGYDFQQMLNDYENGELKRFDPNATSDFVIGTVVNFDISLNDNNEYEGTIKLINAAEFAYTFSTENSLISFERPNNQPPGISNSIKEMFGVTNEGSGDELVPTDRIRRLIEINSIDDKFKMYIMKHTGAYDLSGNPDSDGFIEYFTKSGLRDYLVSLEYVFDVIVVSLIYELFENTIDADLSLNYISKLIDDISRFKNTKVYYSEDLRTIDQTKVIFNNIHLYPGMGAEAEPVNPGKTRIGLPGTNIRTEIISENYYNARFNNYKTKFKAGLFNESRGIRPLSNLFVIHPNWNTDNFSFINTNEVTNINSGGKKHADLKGIFISYRKIREAFLSSSNLMEAINSIIIMVNQASGGAIQLKVRYINSSDDEVKRLTLYDETLVGDISTNYPESAYVFNKRVTHVETKHIMHPESEAMSIDFSFNLPEAAAAMLMVGNNSNNTNMCGNPIDNSIARYGHDSRIKNITNTAEFSPQQQQLLLNSLNPNRRRDNEAEIRTRRDESRALQDSTGTSNQLYGVQIEIITQNEGAGGRFGEDGPVVPKLPSATETEDDSDILNSVAPGLISISGYIEFMPDVMKQKLITDGGLYSTLPSAARVNLKLLGISGFRYGDRFKVEDVLPEKFDDGEFFLIGYKHTITPEGWFTNVEGQFIGKRVTKPRPYVPNVSLLRDPFPINAGLSQFISPSSSSLAPSVQGSGSLGPRVSGILDDPGITIPQFSNLASGVVWDKMDPSMGHAFVVTNQVTKEVAGREVLITSARRNRGDTSLHEVGKAMDVRTRDLSSDTITSYIDKLKGSLGRDYDVVDESLRVDQPHIHIEYHPK
jgi:hypothetical protein